MRIAPLLGLPRFLIDHELDPDTEIRASGCDPALFRDPESTIGLQQVAQLLALRPRTLNRRLCAEKTTFRALLAETRFEIAHQMLRDTHLPIKHIALALGYADAASFNHAFHRWSGTNARAWRLMHRPG